MRGLCILCSLQAKLAARRERRLAEEQRIAEEMAAQKWLEEQDRQMRRGAVAPSEGDLFKAPQVTYTESLEEAALKKEQVRHEMCVHVNLRFIYVGCPVFLLFPSFFSFLSFPKSSKLFLVFCVFTLQILP